MQTRKRLSFLGIGAVASVLAGAFSLLTFVETTELKTYDLRVAATARPGAPSDAITLVAIDDDSIRRMEPLVGRWPWPRLVHATVIDYLAAGGAKVIAYDIQFSERDRRRFMVGDTEWTGEESDAALVDSTRKAGNVVHVAEAASNELVDPSKAVPVELDAPALNLAFGDGGCSEVRPGVTPPFPELAQASRAIGHTLLVYDADGPMRRTPPLVRVGPRTLPSLPLAIAMLVRGWSPAGVSVTDDALVAEGLRVPLIRTEVPDYEQRGRIACRALVPWRGPAQNPGGHPTFTSISFFDLFKSQQQIIEGQPPELDPAVFRDRVVIIGATAQAIGDVFTTSFAEGSISGPEVHANALDGLLANRSIAPIAGWQAAAITIGLAFAVAGAGLFAAQAWLTGVAAAVLAGGFAFLAVAAFGRGAWIPVTVPTLAIVFAFVGDLAWKYVVEGREKRQVKKLFSRYVSKDVYDQLVADPSLAALGGARRHMTVLFSDVRGFTAMTEKGSPEDVVKQLNEYFSRMVAVVFDHRGTVDKFVGDMVMALFGAPLDDDDHAEHAVQTALAMAKALNELNLQWQGQGRPTLDIGIGVNTGDMVAGNIGSDSIMSYTVIGDAVNLGARLESLNKEYGTRIIISDATRVRLKGRYDIHPLGDVVVKGKSKPVAIFEVKTP
jgi:adenylate cyclase